ncbi:MAG: hypothetical protein WC887_00930 [Candidatus Paceibacterota bacterium]|jgi:hypothetical protein
MGVGVSRIIRVSVPEIFYFSVDYGKQFDEMRSSGIFLLTDDGIVEQHFPISYQKKGIIPYEATYLSWSSPMPSFVAARGIIQKDPERPWSLPRIEHAFSLGTIMPEGIHSQRSVAILDAHATVDSEHYAVRMDCSEKVWKLIRPKRPEKWDAFTSFLAVREIA